MIRDANERVKSLNIADLNLSGEKNLAMPFWGFLDSNKGKLIHLNAKISCACVRPHK
jgi:hypothetical protein